MSTSFAAINHLPAGFQLGDFTLITPIGYGGRSHVYLALPPGGGTKIRRWAAARLSVSRPTPELAQRWQLAAIKIAGPAAIGDLYDEHTVLHRVPHACAAGTVALYRRRYPRPGRDIAITAINGASLHWLALEYVAGPSLAEILNRRTGQLDAQKAIAVIAQLACTIDQLHQHMRLAHLDLKPANIILRGGDWSKPVLIDFGTSQNLGALQRKSIYGTERYIAPERLRGAAPSPAADIYALGVILSELLDADAPTAAHELAAAARTLNPTQRVAAIAAPPNSTSNSGPYWSRDNLIGRKGDVSCMSNVSKDVSCHATSSQSLCF
ncbi:MAG: protein kinase [Oscillochloris sp.]|nr:protein kinase [Oscillochloris sp.]